MRDWVFRVDYEDGCSEVMVDHSNIMEQSREDIRESILRRFGEDVKVTFLNERSGR